MLERDVWTWFEGVELGLNDVVDLWVWPCDELR